MKILIPNISRTSIGGAWTFLKNLQKAFALIDGISLDGTPDDYDILFAFAPTTIDGETIARAKAAGKPFILRLDGIPEDSRNSGRGTRRLFEYAGQADYLIYQTEFIRNTVGRQLEVLGIHKPGQVIYNGVDTDVFKPEGGKLNLEGALKIFHINYRKDNNKRVEEVVQMYRELWTYRKDTNLILAGRYPTEWQDYNMGFFAGERFKRVGIMTDDVAKAMIMRSCDFMFYPSYADPAPNVVLEAMACGLPIYYQMYGGADEMVSPHGGVFISGLDDYVSMVKHIENHKAEMGLMNRTRAEDKFSLANMGANYASMFNLVANELKGGE